MTEVPKAADSLPTKAAVYRGLRSFGISLVVVFMLAMLVRFVGGSDPGFTGAQSVARFALGALVLSQGIGIVGLPYGASFLVTAVVPLFSLLFAGHRVTFDAGGPRLERQTALLYGASVALGWVPFHLVGLLVWPRLGVSLLLTVPYLVSVAAFSATVGATGGFLANR
jgi:hypothetical protein